MAISKEARIGASCQSLAEARIFDGLNVSDNFRRKLNAACDDWLAKRELYVKRTPQERNRISFQSNTNRK